MARIPVPIGTGQARLRLVTSIFYSGSVLHELWEDDESRTFCLSGALGDAARAMLGPSAELIWTVDAASHTHAMTIYHAHMGWGEYSSDFPDVDGQLYSERGWEVMFTTRSDGQVDAALVGDWPLFNDALGDSISSLPPRGDPALGPSTYWIDIATEGATLSNASGSMAPFAAGNVTFLKVVGGWVEARYDYDEPDGRSEAIGLDAFLALLRDWRMRVRRSAEQSEVALPETYRRNPHA